MKISALRSISHFFAAVLVFSGIGHGETHRVGGAAPQFDEIVDAVAAAVDGDVIHVNSGTYERFAVDDKDLQIVGLEGSVVVNGLVRVRNISQAKSVRISGLEFRGLDDEALFIYDNLGQVILQDCTLLGRDAVADYDNCTTSALPAAAIEDSVQVTLVDCVIRGGDGARGIDDGYTHLFCFLVNGASALSIYDSNVAVFGGECVGGHGKDSVEAHFVVEGGDGGDGIFVGGGSNIWVAGALVQGGSGSTGNYEGTFSYCGDGGQGGDAIELGQGGGGSTVRELGNILVAGAGGDHGYYQGNDPYYGCYDGPDGLQIRAASGNTVQSLTGSARRIDTVALASDEDTVQLMIEGEPGDQVSLILSSRDAFIPRPRGVLLLANLRLGSARPAGTIPASGVLNIRLPQYDLAASANRELGIQASIVDSTGARHLTNVRWMTVID